MRQVKIPVSDIRTHYTPFKGGIDLESPTMTMAAGSALEAMNYEPGQAGGYRRIDGYERYDGRPAPSAATYLYLEGAWTAMPAAGVTITGATSGAIGVVALPDPAVNAISITKRVGNFVSGETINVAGAPVGVLTAPPTARGYRNALGDAQAMAAAADVYRNNILAVPGSGPILGVWMLRGVVYAFRNNADNTACVMHRAVSTGWQEVGLGEELAFTNAGAALKEGQSLAQSTSVGGAPPTVTGQARIAKIIIESGTLASGTNKGRLIIRSRTGTFIAGSARNVESSAAVTLSGPQVANAFKPYGRFEFVNSNFGGADSTLKMYGCNGVDRAFEFEGGGLVFAFIRTGMENDAPKFIAEHKKKLFLTFDASLQFSADGDPHQWTVMVGAGEIGVGDTITGLAVQAGDTLAVFSRNSSNQLNGNTSGTFQMLPISKEAGAIPYSVQTIGSTLAMDDRGVVSTDRTNAWGNFVQATISQKVQLLIDRIRPRLIASTVYRTRSQYRVYGNDGSGLIVTFGNNGPLGFTQLQYPVVPRCFASGEDSSGRDAVFFGASNGFVYRADSGSSFDGQPIEAYLRMPFDNVGGPRIRKRFRKAVLEMAATAYAAIRFQPEFSNGDPGIGSHRTQNGEAAGGGGYWDVDQWDSFFYDAQLVSSPAFSIEGTGLNMALLFYSSSAIDQGHVLHGMQIHFSPRRLER